MANEFYKNPLRRFVFRRNWWGRVKMRLGILWRTMTKEVFEDYKFVLRGRDVRTILDVGANIGFVTYEFQRDHPQARVYSFEPNPVVFKQLAESIKDNDRVTALNVGVGDVCGDLQFNVNANTGTSSFLEAESYHRTHQARKLLEPITVPVTTLDAFAEEHGLTHVDVLKLDIEGYELKALQGAKKLIEAQAIDLMLIEVSIVPQYEGQPLFHDITAYLLEHGYHLFNLDSFTGGQETPIRQATIGNAIYISTAFRTWLETEHGVKNCGW